VLGEFTIASLLNRTNVQVAINFLGKSSATMSVAVSLAALVLAFVLLLLLSVLGDRRRGSASVAADVVPLPTPKESA
jgi:putative spermidine/putrescine transport system permease protein